MYQLSVAALVLATLFSGAAIYISLVEHPARLELADGPLLAQWQPSYRRALPIQSGLAVAGGVAGLLVCYLSSDWRWAAGSILLLANWPFTLMAIKPVNDQLMATTQSEADGRSRALLVRWGKLHGVRSALGAAAALVFAFTLVGAG